MYIPGRETHERAVRVYRILSLPHPRSYPDDIKPIPTSLPHGSQNGGWALSSVAR